MAIVTRVWLILFIFLSPIISTLLNIPTRWEYIQNVKADVVGIDLAMCSFLLLSVVVFAESICLAEITAVFGLISWLTGISSFYNSALLNVEICLLFFIIGKYEKFITNEIVSRLLITSCVFWMKGGMFTIWLICAYLLVTIGERMVTKTLGSPVSFVVLGLLNFAFALAPVNDASWCTLSSVALGAYAYGSSEGEAKSLISALLLMIGAHRAQWPSLLLLLLLLVALRYGPRLMKQSQQQTPSQGSTALLLLLPLIRSFVVPSPGISRFGVLSTGVHVFIAAAVILSIFHGLMYLYDSWSEAAKTIGQALLSPCFAWAICVRAFAVFGLSPFTIFFACVLAVVATYILAIYAHLLNYKILSLLMISVLWLALAIAVQIVVRLPDSEWYDIELSQRKEFCAKRALIQHGEWISQATPSRFFALAEVSAYRNNELAACRTSFTTPLEEWRRTRVTILGDSVGRFIFYSLANVLVSPEYGFPQAAFHGDIVATENLAFQWAPYAADLVEAIHKHPANVIVISCGLWDKLWKRDPAKYELELDMFFGNVTKSDQLTNLPTVVVIELTPTNNDNLFGQEKELYLSEETAPIWRNHTLSALKRYQGPSFYVPTIAVTKGRGARDGVHYNMHTYQAIASNILRGVSIAK
jgi:hypothetical protein